MLYIPQFPRKTVISMSYYKAEKPQKFDKELQAKFCECISRGLRISQAADACGIDRKTYNNYYNTDPEFKEAFDLAEDKADEVIENALFEAARGGDNKAMQVWLFNRKRATWSDSKNIKIDANIKSSTQFTVRWAENLEHDEEDEETGGDSTSDAV